MTRYFVTTHRWDRSSSHRTCRRCGLEILEVVPETFSAVGRGYRYLVLHRIHPLHPGILQTCDRMPPCPGRITEARKTP